MKITMILLASFLGLSAQAADLTCKNSSGVEVVKLSVANQSLQSLSIQSYELIKNGMKQSDRQIGRSVFGAGVSPLTIREDGSLELSADLHDYSDIRSWTLVISQQTGEASVISTFKSSDGDDLLHVSSENLLCQ